MCGIAGLIQLDRSPVDAGLLEKMSNRLRHRGPDDVGFLGWSGTGPARSSKSAEAVQGHWLGLTHRRLSILDLSPAGWQPMSSQDGRYHIVFNGEIYNYIELRKELEASGGRFVSTSDTEVLLAAYARWGRQCLQRFVGMFAFVILDASERKLFLARDFFAIKPLYYVQTGSAFAFSSEIKALLDLPWVKRQINPQRLYDYLAIGPMDGEPDTVYQQVRQLPPAHCAELNLDQPDELAPSCYWKLTAGPPLDISFDEAAAKLRELFVDSVRLHLRSDVPVGAALSGGIDSSSIVMAIRRLEPQQDIRTFSYIAEEPEICEDRWVDLVGREARAQVHKTRPSPAELVEDLDQLIQVQDVPFGSTSIYAQYRVFKLAHEDGIKVMLDGQGADELLAGYVTYHIPRLESLVRRGRWIEALRLLRAVSALPGASLSGKLRDLKSALIPAAMAVRTQLRRALGKDLRWPWMNWAWLSAHGVSDDTLPAAQSPDRLRERLVRDTVQASLPQLLRYEDRNSMAFSIESRVPFLTPELASFILSLPEEFLLGRDGTSKAVFRAAMRGIVPDAILDRRDKIGFATPEKAWLFRLRPWVERIFQSEAADRVRALNIQACREEWARVLAGRKQFDWRIWRWLNLIRWAERNEVVFED